MMAAQQSSPPQLNHAVVKQVLSGDTVVLRQINVKAGSPPKERILGLSSVVAPKLARRPIPATKDANKDPAAKDANKDPATKDANKDPATKDAKDVPKDAATKDAAPKDVTKDPATKDPAAKDATKDAKDATKDEPYAFEAREFLRKKLVGQRVLFSVDSNTQNTSREYGTVFISNGKDPSSLENVTESLVAEGLVDVRRSGIKSTEIHQRLCELEDSAKAAGKGKHGPHASKHVRDIKWSVENPRNFMDSLHQKRVKAIVEHVRDGSTLRVLLRPDSSISEYYHITLMLSGLRCPTFRDDVPEPFAEEARYFTECRLLQRDVEVILESVSNQNFLGTVIHPKGNITELLLAEGLAKCVDWSLHCVTVGLEKLRVAEKSAKEKRLRLWKDWAPSGPAIDAKDKEFQGKVVEVINADGLIVKVNDGSTKKIFLASIRPPRLPDNSPQNTALKMRPLYEIPCMFEAREYLRKKLIGKKVNVTVDYIQKANNNFPERVCCTVTIGGINVAEALVSKGYATVVRYRADDDQRSAHYDELLSGETKAMKAGRGVHSKKKDHPPHRVVDLSGDLQKSKQFFPFFQRASRMEAIVEFITSGSRLRLFVPRENCLMTFLLGGITCQRTSRDTRTGNQPGDEYGNEAMLYTKDLCMQKDVQVEVDSMDKAGNFIGWLWIDNINLSEALVKEGFAEVHSTAARSPYYRQLQVAQEEAQNKRLRIWKKGASNEVEVNVVEDTSERSVNYTKVMVTEVREDLNFYCQSVEEGPQLDELMLAFRQDFVKDPPTPGTYVPKKGDLCAALFEDDGLWYRAKIDRVSGNHVSVTYIDFGNKAYIPTTSLATLPLTYQALPPCAHEYALAFIKAPQDIDIASDIASDATVEFHECVDNKVMLLNVEYNSGPLRYVTLTSEEELVDIGKELVLKGLAFVERRKEKKFQTILEEYVTAQETAKKERLNLWQYGDITEDDAKEFG